MMPPSCPDCGTTAYDRAIDTGRCAQCHHKKYFAKRESCIVCGIGFENGDAKHRSDLDAGHRCSRCEIARLGVELNQRRSHLQDVYHALLPKGHGAPTWDEATTLMLAEIQLLKQRENYCCEHGRRVFEKPCLECARKLVVADMQVGGSIIYNQHEPCVTEEEIAKRAELRERRFDDMHRLGRRGEQCEKLLAERKAWLDGPQIACDTYEDL